jgi:hypothetical protein
MPEKIAKAQKTAERSNLAKPKAATKARKTADISNLPKPTTARVIKPRLNKKLLTPQLIVESILATQVTDYNTAVRYLAADPESTIDFILLQMRAYDK